MRKITFIAAILVLVFLTAWFYKSKRSDTKKNISTNAQTEATHDQGTKPEVLPAINGQLVEPAVAQNRPIAVMVENHPDSRPQSGLSDADLVYETVAEGGITRFLAVYQTSAPQTIGPVRSARDYYAVLADELGALYAHVGGSNEVIDQLKRGVYKNLSDANEYYNESFFQRMKSKSAPHNVYTTLARLRELLAYHKYSEAVNFTAWQFKDDSPAQTEAAKINIDFSLPGFEASYAYDQQSNSYKRILSGKPHIDAANKQQITAKNVVAQYVTVTPVPRDPLLRVDINLHGSGKAVVFLDGKAIRATWRKEGTERTRYFDEQGQEIKFNRGKIWVGLVPAEKTVSWQ